MVDTKELKMEIDSKGNNNDKIEVGEMEEFLKSNNNLKKLWEAMKWNIDSELLNEFHMVISELCDKMPEMKKCTLNQYKIMLFYLEHFEPKEPIDKKDKLVKIYNKVKKKVDKAAKDYLKEVSKGKHIETGPVAALEREEEMIRILKHAEETAKKQTEELIANGGLDPNKIMWEMMKKFNEEKARKEWDTDKQKIRPILDKKWTLTEDEKNQLLKFKTKYYYYHKNYNNPHDRGMCSVLILLSPFDPSEEYDDIAAKIDRKMDSASFNYIDGIVSKQELPQKIDINWLSTIHQWIKKYWDTTNENRENKEKIEWIVANKIESITKTFAKKDVDKIKLDKSEIWIFQLRANIEYWENLTINGVKKGLDNKKSVTEWEITTLYIYRQRLSVREVQATELQIPEINNLLWQLKNEDAHKIMKEFLIFFFSIKNTEKNWWWENKIWWSIFKNILELMIYSKMYELKDINKEIETRTAIKNAAEPGSQIYLESEQMIKSFQEMKKEMSKKWKESNISVYYNKLYAEQKNLITTQNKKNIDAYQKYLKEKAENERRNKLNEKLNWIISRINQLDPSDATKYKNKYKAIADDFIKIWKKDKDLLKNNPLCSQIFIEIYCLWKSNVKATFWETVEKECNKYKDQLGLISEKDRMEYENIADIYYQVNELNDLIANWAVWEEIHYDKRVTETRVVQNTCPVDWVAQTMRVSSAYQNSPQVRQMVEQQACSHRIEKINKVVHVDTYKWPRYNENYETVVELKYDDGRVKRYHAYGTKDYNPRARLVSPNPNWWYAILPEALKKKANQWKIKLGIINDVACVYEFENGQDIRIWKFNKTKKKLERTATVITVEQYTKALSISNLQLKIWDAEYGEQFKTIQDELQSIIGKQDDLQGLLEEWKNEDLDKMELKRLQSWAIKVYDLTKKFANNRNKLIQIKNALLKLNQNTNNYENPHEKQIRELIENVDKILEFTTQDNVNKAREFRDFCLNNVERNDTFWSRRKQWLPTLLAFIATIAITVASCWTLWRVWAVLVSSAAGIAVHETTQIALNNFAWYGSVTVDGVEHKTHYTNPTLIEQALDPNSDVTLRDCVKQYALQYGLTVLTQLVFMQAWSSIGKYVSARISKAPAWSFARNTANLVCKVLCKENINGDAFTKWLVDSIERQVTKQWFMKTFSKELLEETWEETVENAAEEVSPVLWAIATLVHCIKPKPWMELQWAKVWTPTITIKWKENITAKTTYDWNNPNNINILKNYYNNLNNDAGRNEDWYRYEVEIEWDILKVTVKWAIIWNWWTVQKDVQLEFHPSKASLDVRSIPTELADLWWITINHETWEVSYSSDEQLEVLWLYCEEKWIWKVEINAEDWTATLTVGKNVINITKGVWNINWGSPEIDIINNWDIDYTNQTDSNHPKIDIDAENFEIPLKNWECEYISTKSGKPAEEKEITTQQAKECFFNGLDVTAQLMEWQSQWAVLSSWSLFLNNPEFMKLWWDIDVATDVQTFRNVALEKQPNWKTKLDQFKDEWKIKDLKFTFIWQNHKEIDIKTINESELNLLIAQWDIRVEFNIPSKDWLFMINCEFFPEPKWYWLIQLWTARTEWKLNTYTINGREIKTVNEELAAMSYMINLAHEIDNNSIEWIQKWKKLKDSVRINNFIQYLSSIWLNTPHEIIEFIDKTKNNYESQTWEVFTINKNGENVDINMSDYLRTWINKLGQVREILTVMEWDYNKTVLLDESWWSETTISFNQFMKETFTIKKWLIDGSITIDEAIEKVTALQLQIDIKDPKNFAYYYEIYQLRKEFEWKIVQIERTSVDGENRNLTTLRNIEKSEFQDISNETLTEMWNELRDTFWSTNYDSFDLYLRLIRNRKSWETLRDSFRTLDLSGIDKSKWTICTWMARLLQTRLSKKWVRSHMIRFQAWWTQNNEYLWDWHTALIVPRKLEDWSLWYTLLDPWLLISQPLTFWKWENPTVDAGWARYKIVYTWNSEYPFSMQQYKINKETQQYELKKEMPFNPNQEWLNPEQTLNTEILRVFTDFKIAKQDTDWNNLALIRLTIWTKTIDIRYKWCEKMPELTIDEFRNIKNSPRYQDFIKTCEILWRDPDVMYNELMTWIENLDKYISTIQNTSPAK